MSEQDEIKRDGGRAQKNSGRGKHDKGDAVLEPFLYDIKEYAKSFSVSIENWGKVCMDAIAAGRRQPAFKLVLGEEGKQRIRVWVISDSMFKEMREAWLEKYDN